MDGDDSGHPVQVPLPARDGGARGPAPQNARSAGEEDGATGGEPAAVDYEGCHSGLGRLPALSTRAAIGLIRAAIGIPLVVGTVVRLGVLAIEDPKREPVEESAGDG